MMYGLTSDALGDLVVGHERWLAGRGDGVRLVGGEMGCCDGEPDFSGARLMFADLSCSDWRDADFSECDLAHADLSYSDLRGAAFTGANLGGANLVGADLRGAVLPGAWYPIVSGIHAAVFEATSGPLSLHACDGENHEGVSSYIDGKPLPSLCHAAWVVRLTGQPGSALAYKVGVHVAAALIYYASDPTMSEVPVWSMCPADARAEMEAWAYS